MSASSMAVMNFEKMSERVSKYSHAVMSIWGSSTEASKSASVCNFMSPQPTATRTANNDRERMIWLNITLRI